MLRRGPRWTAWARRWAGPFRSRRRSRRQRGERRTTRTIARRSALHRRQRSRAGRSRCQDGVAARRPRPGRPPAGPGRAAGGTQPANSPDALAQLAGSASANSGTASVPGMLPQPLGHLAGAELGQHAVQHDRGRHQAQRRLDRLHAVGHVVGREALLARPRAAPRGACARRPRPPAPAAAGLRPGAEERHREREDGALAGLALDRRAPAVRAHDAVADVEAQPRALDVRRCARSRTRENGRNSRSQVRGRDADALVAHAHHGLLALAREQLDAHRRRPPAST